MANDHDQGGATAVGHCRRNAGGEYDQPGDDRQQRLPGPTTCAATVAAR